MKKLKLNKKVIIELAKTEMNNLKGGSDWFCTGTGGGNSCYVCNTDPRICIPPTPPPSPDTDERTLPPRCCDYGCCETIGC